MFTKENQQIPNIKQKKKRKEDQIRSNQDLIRLIEIGAGMLGEPLLCDRCDGATVGSVRAERSMRWGGSVWLGTSWVREKASRERKKGSRD